MTYLHRKVSRQSLAILLFLACWIAPAYAGARRASTSMFQDLPGREVARRVLWSKESARDASPVRLSWGRYHVVIKGGASDGDDYSILSIVNAKGGVIKQVTAEFIDEVGLIDITGRKPGNLYVLAAPMANTQSLVRTYYFTQSPSVHTLMIAVGTLSVVHRTPGGRIVTASFNGAPMEWFPDLSHARNPAIVVIGELRGHRFHLTNRRYPQSSVRAALAYRKELMKEPLAGPSTMGLGEAIGYYANLQTIGRGSAALIWLHRHLSPTRWDEFAGDLAEVNRRMRRLSQLVWTNGHRNYTVTTRDEPWWPDR